jgi:hypothetical protein
VEGEIGSYGGLDAGLEGWGEAVGEDIDIGGAAGGQIGSEGVEHDGEGEGVVGVGGAGDGEGWKGQNCSNYRL